MKKIIFTLLVLLSFSAANAKFKITDEYSMTFMENGISLMIYIRQHSKDC
jgi:hypothetical protein